MPPSRPAHKSSSTTSPTSSEGTGHAGFVNLGNTCFLNSVLQAASATTALRDLYHPPSCQAPGLTVPQPTAWESTLGIASIDRTRSPVLCLVDEEKGRSRRTSEASQQAQKSSSASSSSSADVPLNTTFRHVLEQTWSTHNSPAATATSAGSGSSTPRRLPNAKPSSVNPKALLGALTKKYAEYGEYGQQDGHELLRHLLDAMRMEELDLIKKLQPPPSPSARRRKSPSVQPAPMHVSAAPRTAAALLAAEEAEGEASTPRATHATDPLLLAQQHPLRVSEPLEEQVELKPFVDAVFGGKLLSAVVCEGCKQVSHTYEDFLDISLSLRPEAEGKVKRDRITRMADRWRKVTTGTPPRPRSAAETSKAVQRLEEGQLSETESASRDEGQGIVRPKSAMPRPMPLANSPRASPAPALHGEGPSADERDRTRDLLTRDSHSGNESEIEADAATAGTGAAVPGAAAMNLAPDVTVYADAERAFAKPSGGLFRAVSRSSKARKSAAESLSRDGSPAPPESTDGNASDLDHSPRKKQQQTRQSAYTSKLFADLPAKSEASHGSAGFLWGRWGVPAASGGTITSVAEAAAAARTRTTSQSAPTNGAAAPVDALAAQAGTGLVKALASFTAVEVLDGDNSYACKRCWRLANPATPAERARQMRRRARRGENHDDSEKSSDDVDSDGAPDEFDDALQDITTAATSLDIGSTPSSKPASLEEASSKSASRSPSIAPIVTHDHISNEATLTPRSGTLLASAAAAAATQVNGAGSNSASSSCEELRSIMRPIPIIQTTSPVTPIAPSLPSASPRWPGADGTLQAPQAVAPGPLRRLRAEGSDYSTSDEETETTATTTGDETDFSATSASEAEPRSGTPSRAPSAHLADRAHLPTRRRSTQSVPRRALKRYLIASTPPVLVFHFKRFQHVNRTYGFSSFASGSKKIDDFVSFPEFLDVAPWLAPPREEYDRAGKLKRSSDARALRAAELEAQSLGGSEGAGLVARQKKQARWHWPSGKTAKAPESTPLMPRPRTQYKLYAVVVHQGTMTSGHYTAFILAPKPGVKSPNGATGSSTTCPKDASSAVPDAESSTDASSTTTATMERGLSTSSASSAAPSTTSSRASADSPSSAPVAASAAAQEERQWLYTSDTTVRTATIEEVLRAKAYMTFYEQL